MRSSILSILSVALGFVLPPLPARYKIKGLVIDPYNELEAPAAVRHGRVKETDYISAMLSKVRPPTHSVLHLPRCIQMSA